MKLAMTLIIRDEADILEDNLRYHRAQGVDFFIALDNGSTDGTLEILESYERAGILTLVRMPGTMLTIQRKGHTQIARLAHELGADWVFHNDADEFWWPVNGNLKEAFEGIPDNMGIVLAPRTEFIPRPDGPGSFAERLTIREARFRRPPKTAHRTHPAVKLWTAHPIDIWVKREAPPRGQLAGKPALRVEATHQEEHELDLVMAPIFPVGVLHFPLRSFEQYEKKIALADVNRLWERNAEARALHDAYESGRLEEVFQHLLLDDDAIARGVSAEWLVEDTEFRDYMLACPGVFEDGEAPPGARAWPQERRDAALAALREDGMYLISRYMQTIASKKRRRQVKARELKRLRAEKKESKRELRELQRRSKRLERRSRRLEKVEQSRWWRLRPRLPRQRREDH